MGRYKFFFLAFALTLFAATAFAAGKVNPRSTGYYRMGSNGVGGTVWGTRTEFEALWSGASGGSATSFITKTGALSSSTVGSLARKAIRGGVYGAAIGLAVEQIVNGAGWAIDELQSQVTTPGTPPDPLNSSGVWCMDKSGWGGQYSGTRCANTPLAAAYDSPTGDGAVPTSIHTGSSSDTTKNIIYQPQGYLMPVLFLAIPPFDAVNGNPSVDASPISDEDLGDKIKESPELVNDLLTDPRTGAVIVTPEMQQQMQDILDELDSRGGDPSDPATPSDLDDDQAQDTTESEWPTFCSWASVVCRFIDWYKEPPPEDGDPEIPHEEETSSSGWVSGLSDGSCPAPYQLSFTNYGAVSYDWQPWCDFAVRIKPFTIASCSLAAIFILTGFSVRQRGG